MAVSVLKRPSLSVANTSPEAAIVTYMAVIIMLTHVSYGCIITLMNDAHDAQYKMIGNNMTNVFDYINELGKQRLDEIAFNHHSSYDIPYNEIETCMRSHYEMDDDYEMDLQYNCTHAFDCEIFTRLLSSFDVVFNPTCITIKSFHDCDLIHHVIDYVDVDNDDVCEMSDALHMISLYRDDIRDNRFFNK